MDLPPTRAERPPVCPFSHLALARETGGDKNRGAGESPAQPIVFRVGCRPCHRGQINARFSLSPLVRAGSTPARAKCPLRGILHLTHAPNLTIELEPYKNFCFSSGIFLSEFQTGACEILTFAGGAQ